MACTNWADFWDIVDNLWSTTGGGGWDSSTGNIFYNSDGGQGGGPDVQSGSGFQGSGLPYMLGEVTVAAKAPVKNTPYSPIIDNNDNPFHFENGTSNPVQYEHTQGGGDKTLDRLNTINGIADVGMDIAEQSGYVATIGRTGYYLSGWNGNQYVKTLGVAKGLGYVFFGASLVMDGAMYFTGQQSGLKTSLNVGVNTTSLIIGGIPGILIGGGYLYIDKVLAPEMQRNPEHWSRASDTWTLYGSNCFVEGTKISMEEGIFRNIEDVQIGDSVLTYNFVKKKLERNSVLEIDSPIHNKFVKITFSNGEEVTSTEDHPYYVQGKGWSSFNPNLTSLNYGIEAGKIEVSDLCFTIKGGKLKRIKITQIIKLDRSVRTYNLTKIDNSDNYFVNGILVNNESKTGLNINK